MIDSEVGRGGAAVIYKAKDQQTDTWVAIKHLMLPEQFEPHQREHMIQRFMNECRLMQFLDHPNIMKVFDAFEENNQHYMVMEFLKGVNLKDLLTRLKPTHTDLLMLLEQIAGVLEYAHSRTIAHRDIKPDNIMLVRPQNQLQVKLLDFGIARLEVSQRLTTDGTLLGTLAYMSPEQLQNSHNITHQTDIYSLGVVMYELFTGQLPFNAPTPALAILQIFSHEATPVMELNPTVGPDLNELIMTCMNKHIHNRFASADLLRRRVRELLNAVYLKGLTPTAQSEPGLAKIRSFEDFRLIEIFEKLYQNTFSGECLVWNAFQESKLFFAAGCLRGIETRKRQLEGFEALSDVVCWEAGNFCCTPSAPAQLDQFGLEMPALLSRLKETQKEFRLLWDDYQDLDLPELIQKPSASDRFGSVAQMLLEALEKGMCIGQLYTLIPNSRLEILAGIKELEDRQFIFINRERNHL